MSNEFRKGLIQQQEEFHEFQEDRHWEHEMIEHPDPPEEREGYLPDDED
jgi:hypothetical protein